jgi:hypothetical protein
MRFFVQVLTFSLSPVWCTGGSGRETELKNWIDPRLATPSVLNETRLVRFVQDGAQANQLVLALDSLESSRTKHALCILLAMCDVKETPKTTPYLPFRE